MNIMLTDIYLPAFYDFRKAIKEDYLFYILKGGRGSSKSSHASLEMIIRRMRYNSHALVLRKFGVYLDKSVFEQCKWAINTLQVTSHWKASRSPLKLTYTKTGASIFFMGADDSERIKSIKTADMPITDLWIEEATEFKTEEEITTIVNSIVRAELDAGLKYKVILSYNPPKRKTHWLNKKYETQFVNSNVYVHHSDYRDNKYISQQMLDEIEHTKLTKQQRYEWEYLGKPTGSGVVPFDNLQFRKIINDEIQNFDNIKQGVDFGYGVDPLCFLRMHYDRTRRTIYIFDEIYGTKISNRELAGKIKSKQYNDTVIYCDSAEPKSIAELCEYGLHAKGATKGAGSVEHGEKWLDDLEAIVIDADRVPHTTKEFENIDYMTDKDGNAKAKLLFELYGKELRKTINNLS